MNPCSFYQKESDVAGLAHSDDVFFCGPRWALKRRIAEMEEKFEIRAKNGRPFH